MATIATAKNENAEDPRIITAKAAAKNSVWKKPARLSPNAMGIVIPQSLVELLNIDDEQTWVEEIPTNEGLLLRIVNGMPSSNES